MATSNAGAPDSSLAAKCGTPSTTRWAGDRLVTDKWFSVQVALAAPDAAAKVVETLTARTDFDWKNPNRFRAVLGALSANHAGFHQAGGAGYGLIGEWLLRLDPVNPQTAARVSTAFETWPRYDATRRKRAKADQGEYNLDDASDNSNR